MPLADLVAIRSAPFDACGRARRGLEAGFAPAFAAAGLRPMTARLGP